MNHFVSVSLAAALLVGCTTPYSDPYDDPYYPEQRYDPYGEPYAQAIPGRVEPYRAIGNEPFWSLEIDDRDLRFESMNGLRLDEPLPRVERVYDGYRFAGRRVAVDIRPRPCSDGMSDRRYPDTVRVWVDGREWQGCGGPERLFRPSWEEGAAPDYDYRGYEDSHVDISVPLARTNWRVTRVNGLTVPSGGFYLNFLPDRLQARFGCNDMTGSYRQAQDRLTVSALSMTRMACPDMSVETRASNILSSPMTVRLDGDRLMLRNDRGTITATRAD